MNFRIHKRYQTKSYILIFVAVIILGILLCGCNPSGDGTNVVDTSVQATDDTLCSESGRIYVDKISHKNKELLIDGIGTFAINHYHQLSKTESNLILSPYSITSALAMTYAGARGATEKQIAEALSFTLPQPSLHTGFNWLESTITHQTDDNENTRGEFTLDITNDLWGQKDFMFLESFLNTLATNYGSCLKICDFINQPEPSRSVINKWISQQTHNLINNLIPQGAINKSTRLILTNVIYFNASWKDDFHETSIRDVDFTCLDNSITSIPMMKQTTTYGYVRYDDFCVVELPYVGEKKSMVIVLPDKGSFNEFEKNLHYEEIKQIFDDLSEKQVTLTMPIFKIESSFSLKQQLSKLGMPLAFSGDADFSGISPESEPVFIGDIIHKAFIEVDTKGTTATAATAVFMVGSAPNSSNDSPINITIDRPFIFLIRDIETGTVLFLGRYISPEQKETLQTEFDQINYPSVRDTGIVQTEESISGKLIVNDRFIIADQHILIWSEEYTIKSSGNDIWIGNQEGAILARVGDTFTFQGMSYSSAHLSAITDFQFPDEIAENYSFFVVSRITK